MSKTLKLEISVADLGQNGVVVSEFATTDYVANELSKKATLNDEGKVDPSLLPDYTYIDGLVDKLDDVEQSYLDADAEILNAAKLYSDNKISENNSKKADLVEGKVPFEQLPFSMNFEQNVSTEFENVRQELRQNSESIVAQMDGLVGSANSYTDSKVLEEREFLNNTINEYKGEVNSQLNNFDNEIGVVKNTQDDIIKNGASLPYDPDLEYVDGAVVLKDERLQIKQGINWKILGTTIASEILNSDGKNLQELCEKLKGNVIFLEDFGGTEGADCSDALQSCFDYVKNNRKSQIKTNLKSISISKRCVYHDNTNIDFNNCKVTLIGNGQISSALYNSDRSDFIGFSGAEIYYKYQATKTINNPNSRISIDVPSKASSISVSDSSGFTVGDYILISNGYCDMWRVMEKYHSEGAPAEKSRQDWVKPEVDLWRCEIARIKSISGNTIILEDELENEYKSTTKTYGFFADENNRADHNGWNYPFIERLGGASNCTFKNLIMKNEGSASVSLVSYCGVNNKVLDSVFTGKGQGADFITCFNSHILRSYSETESFGLSIRRGSYMCIMANASAKYVSGDCPLIIWEGAQHCIANNIQVDGTGGNTSHAKIGFYFNTCWNCIGNNFTGKNLDSVVGVLFCRGNIIVNNMNGVNCGVLFGAYSTFDVKADIGTLKGDYLDSPSIYDASLFYVSECNNIEISKLRSFEKYSSTKNTGRAHIFKSFAVDLKDIDAPNVILWNSVDDDKKYEPSKFKMKTKDCVFKLAYLTQTYNDGEAQTRRTYFRDTDFMQFVDITCTHNTELNGVVIKGLDVNVSLKLTISSYTRLIDCIIENATSGIDFLGTGASGAQNWTSLVYMRNTVVNAPTRFLNYNDPSYMLSIGSGSPKGKGIQYISVLTNYPNLRTFANPGMDGNRVGWYMVEDTRQVTIESLTTAQLSNKAHAINSIGSKWLGREVYNSTLQKFMKSKGTTTTSAWVSTDGQNTITPV